MSEPTSAQSIEDLMIKVARESGIAYYGSTGQERAMVPIDAHDLDLVMRMVRDGIRMFIADAPRTGWRWMHRNLSVSVTSTRITGTADSASTTTVVDSDLCEAQGTLTAEAGTNATTLVDASLTALYTADDELNGKYCYIISGTGAGSFAVVTDYVASTGTITVADWLDSSGNPGGTDPVSTDTFGLSGNKILVGYYVYITSGLGDGSNAVITGFNSSDGTITVADWLYEAGGSGGTDPTVGSTLAITPVETVGGDIYRYPLPEYFGSQEGQITYAGDTNHASAIEWCDEALIRSRRSITVNVGYPLLAAIRPLEYAAGSTVGPKRRQEIIFDPKPSADDVLEFPYDLYFNEVDLFAGDASSVDGSTGLLDSSLDALYPNDYFNGWVIKIISGTGKNSYATVTDYEGATAKFIVADWLSIDGTAAGTDPAASSVYVVQPANNLHPAGFRFDEVVESACLAKAEMLIEDMQGGGFVAKYQNDLANAMKLDMRSAPRSVGSMNKKERYIRDRVFKDITYNT